MFCLVPAVLGQSVEVIVVNGIDHEYPYGQFDGSGQYIPSQGHIGWWDITEEQPASFKVRPIWGESDPFATYGFRFEIDLSSLPNSTATIRHGSVVVPTSVIQTSFEPPNFYGEDAWEYISIDVAHDDDSKGGCVKAPVKITPNPGNSSLEVKTGYLNLCILDNEGDYEFDPMEIEIVEGQWSEPITLQIKSSSSDPFDASTEIVFRPYNVFNRKAGLLTKRQYDTSDGQMEREEHLASIAAWSLKNGGEGYAFVLYAYEDDDIDDEEGEVFAWGVEEPGNVFGGQSTTLAVKIIDNEKPKITLTTSANQVNEGESITITATVSENLARDVVVPLTYLHADPLTAESGDYSGPASITIEVSGNNRDVTATITTSEDDDWEDETFRVEIDEAGLRDGILAGNPKSQLITIIDDDKPAVTLTANPTEVAEGYEPGVVVTVTIAEDPAVDVTIPLKYENDTAEDTDYEGPESITIPGNGSIRSWTGVIRILQEEDVDWEDETFTVAIDEERIPPIVVAGDPISEKITIIDDDKPTVTFTVSQTEVEEGASSGVVVTVTFTGDPPRNVVIPLVYSHADPLTAEPDDYKGPENITVSGIGDGMSGTGKIEIPQETAVDWEDETFTVAIDENMLPPTVLAGGVPPQEITIIDDDKPTVTLTVEPDEVLEGDASGVAVIVTMTGDPVDDVVIPLAYSHAPPLTAESGDYSGPINITISGNGNGMSGTGKIEIPQETAVDWEDETFTVAIEESGLPPTVLAGDPKLQLITIIDDDKPTVNISASPETVEEGETITITVKLSEGLPDAVEIPLILSDGTAEDEDYGPLTPNPIRIAANTLDGSGTIAAILDDKVEDDETFTVELGDLPSTVTAGSPNSILLTIRDKPIVSLSATTPVNEGDEVTVTVELSKILLNAVEIPLTLIEGSAMGDDYGPLIPNPITIPANSLTGTGTIATIPDNIAEQDETFTVELGGLPSAVIAGSPSSVPVIIRERPQVTLSAFPNPVEEGNPVTITASLSRALPNAVTVSLTVTPITAGGDDYGTLIPNPITIPANSLVGIGTIATIQDELVEEDETFIVAIHENNLSTTVIVGDPKEVRVTINDDDKPVITLEASPNPVKEGEGITITATISENISGNAVVPLTITAGTAEPDDYGNVTEATITISGGGTNTTGNVPIMTFDDEDDEDETFTVAINENNLAPNLDAGEPRSVEVTIEDDDKLVPSTVTLRASARQVEEGGSITVTATMFVTQPRDVVIPLEYVHGTTEDGDYLPLDAITIPQGELMGADDLRTIDDDVYEEDETFTVAINADQLPEEIERVSPFSAEITIINNDSPPPVEATLSVDSDMVDEGNSVTVTVNLATDLDTDVTIPLVLTDISTVPQDYSAPNPVQVEITAGEITGQYIILTANDDIDEEDEIFRVAIEKDQLHEDIKLGEPSEIDVMIIDDDVEGINAPESITVREGDTESFNISLTSEPLDEVTVMMTWAMGEDLAVTPVTQTFTPDNWDQGQEVTLRAGEDDDFENEQIQVTLTAAGGGYIGRSKVLNVTIIDNDAAGIVVAPPSVIMDEGTAEEIKIALAQQPSSRVTLAIPGSAGDLTATPLTLTFTPNTWNEEQPVRLTAAKDDDLGNDLEILTLRASGGNYAGVEQTVQITIIDIDEPQIIALDKVTIDEGNTYPFMVRLSAKPSESVNVTLSGHEGTSLTLSETSIPFTPTTWNSPQTVRLTAADDAPDYADETIELTLTASGNGYEGVTHTTVVTIIDDDESALTISILDQQGHENEGSLQLRIELNRSTDEIVTVQYTSSDVGEAEAGLDYTASRGIVIFDPGATRGVIEIEVIEDNISEGIERFEVALSNASNNAQIKRGTGVGTILDNSGNAVLRVEDLVVLEEAEMAEFQISLSHPQHQMVTAEYRTQDGTAKAGEDYEAASGIVTLAPGVMEAIISVPILKDGLDWSEETFTVHLVSSKHAEIEKAVGVAIIQESTTASEKVMEAYAARFVRTASVQVVDALGGRFRQAADGAVCAASERTEMAQLWYSASSWDPSLGELLAGCRMSQSMPVSSGSLGVWGQGAFRQFNGAGEDALTLRGEVTTGMLGADYRWKGGWLAGVLLAHSQGDGSFEMKEESGDVTSALTGIYPYVSYMRAGWEVWVSAGAGRGNAEVLELKGDLTSRFGALGMRGTLASVFRHSGGSTRLSYHGDILVTDAEIDKHGITAEVYRVRAGLEASAQITGGIRPYVEANVRQDGGSAETGTGLELGGGVRFANPAWHLRGEVRTQGLVMHTADGFTDWGLSGSLQMGRATEGLMMRLRPSWGRGQGMSMYRQQTILDAVPLGADMYRTELELGYGIPWKEGSARSVAGMTQLPQGRMYRLGGELRPWDQISFSVFGLAHGHEAVLGNIGVNVQGVLRY